MNAIQDLIVRLRDTATTASTTVIVVLAVVAVISVIVGACLYVAYLLSPRGRLDLLLEGRASRRGINVWLVRLAVLSAVVIIVFSLRTYLRAPATCASCHKEVAYAKTLGSSVHAGVGCMQCHGGTGVVAPLSEALTYATWEWDYYVANRRPKAPVGSRVKSRSCLRCHQAIMSSTRTVNGVRVRHKDFVDAGSSCTECHGDVTHAVVGKAQTRPTMDNCLPCHDGKRASSACPTCHGTDIGVASATRMKNMALVGIPETLDWCYQCHDPSPCTRCHGIRMPHPQRWAPDPAHIAAGSAQPGILGIPPGSHAREGFAHREVCWRCHHAPGKVFVPDDSSCSCHGVPGSMHGGSTWVAEHGLEATGLKTGTASDCVNCHGPAETFCGWCHPPSFARRYGPQPPGPDNYTRLEPRTPQDLEWFGQY